VLFSDYLNWPGAVAAIIEIGTTLPPPPDVNVGYGASSLDKPMSAASLDQTLVCAM